MKTENSTTTLVLSFFLISIFIVTGAGCGDKETPDKQQTPEEQQTPEVQQTPGEQQVPANNNPTLQIDTTAIEKDIILPSSASDSLLNYFRNLAKGTDSQLIKEYPAGYGILMLNNKKYSNIINLKDDRIYLSLNGSFINKLNDKEMKIFIKDMNVETISAIDLYHPFTLDYKPRQIFVITTHFIIHTQLLMKTDAGMIVLVGFKER